MRVRAVRLFRDRKADRLRKAGEVFEVTQKRAGELNAGPHGVLVEILETKKKRGEIDEKLQEL